jgi:hypothetical protein
MSARHEPPGSRRELGTLELWDRSSESIGREPVSNRQRPTEEARKQLTQLVIDLRDATYASYKLWLSIRSQHHDLPQPKEIRKISEEKAAKQEHAARKQRRNRKIILYTALVLAGTIVLAKGIYALFWEGNYSEAGTELLGVCGVIAGHFMGHAFSIRVHPGV